MLGMVIYGVLHLLIRKKSLPKEEIDDSTSKGDFLATILSDHPTPSVEIFLIIVGALSVGMAAAMYLHLPFLITAVTAGFLIANFHSHALFDSLKLANVMPIFNLMFFALIGSNIHLNSFFGGTLFQVGAYVLLRGAGKILGTKVGCYLTKQDRKISVCLPNLMLPQAGMAAVETMLVAAVLDGGQKIFDVTIPALIIFELGGAYLSERTLKKWKAWTGQEAAMEENLYATVTGEDLDFTNLIGPRIITNMKASNRNEAIFELASELQTRGMVTNTEVVTVPCLEREKLMSTAVGSGIALPHCRTGEVERCIAVCGLFADRSIPWDPQSSATINMVILLISPVANPERHLSALRAISHTLTTTNFRQGLIDAIKVDQIGDYLGNLESDK